MMKRPLPRLAEMVRDLQHPGAIVAFRELWMRGRRMPWILALAARSAGWLLWLSVVVAYLLPHNIEIVTPQVSSWLLLYFLYLILLEGAAFTLPRQYERTWFKLFRIQVNIILVSVLIALSSGSQSYFWFFYSLPLFAAVIYFRRIAISAFIYVEILALWLGAIGSTVLSGSPFDLALFATNSSILLLLLLVLHYMFHFQSESVQERERQLATLNEASQALASTLERGRILELVMQYARHMFKVEAVSLLFCDNRTREASFRVGLGDQVRELPGSGWPLERGIIGWVANNRQPLLIHDVKADPRWDPSVDELTGFATETVLCVPLVVRHEVIGAIKMLNKVGGDFTEDDLNLLNALAASTSVAMENAHLFEDTQRKAREMAALHQVAAAASSSLDLEEVLDQIYQQVSQLMQVDTFYIALCDERTSQITFDPFICRGKRRDKFTRKATEDGGFTRWIIQSGQPLHINDVETEQDRLPVKGVLLGDPTRSWLGLPLRVKDRVVGVISIQSDKPYAFDENARHLLQTIANDVGIAVENARLHERVKGWARQLDALDNIILDIATRLEIPTLLRAIVQRATELLEATGGGIYLLMETGDTFRLEAVYGLPSSLEGHLVNRERGVIGQTIKTRQPLAVAAYREWPNRLQMLDEYNLTSVVAAPILSGERVLGAIAIHDTTQERQFGKEDLDLLLRIANHAAVAIENGKVFAEESQRLEEIQRLYEEQNAIYKASQALVSVLDYDELLDKVLEVLTDQLQYPCCAILLIDEAVNELYIERARNYPAEVQQGTRIKIGGEKGITGQVAATGEPLVVPDVTQEPRYIPGIPNGRSEISVALKMGGKIIGVLDVESTRVNAFNERDQRILTALAAQVAIAIQNAYHHRQIQERQRHLEAVYEASKTILTTVERQEVLDLIVKEAVQRVSGAKGEQALSGSFRAFELDTRSLVLTAAYPAEELSKMRARIGDRIPLDGSRPDGRIGVNGRAAKTRAARLVPDVAKDPDYIAYRPDTRSELVVPVLDGERLLGVLDMEHSRPNAFNESHVKALEALAGLAAIAIKNAEQAERIRHAITLALLGAWGADLAHEINREVGHIRRIIHLLQLRSDLPAEAKDKLQDIDRSADRLRLPSLPGQTPEPDRGEEFENTAVLDQVVKMEVEALVQYWPAITFDSDLQCPGVRVAMHVYWLRRLVRHLVRNATQAIPSTKTLRRVTVRTRVRDDTGEIEVEDTGQGVSPEVHDLFFDSLAPYPDGHQGKGLLLVRFILEQYGGALRLVWSHLGEGACFAISIPIAR